jgi:hypothetical protein
MQADDRGYGNRNPDAQANVREKHGAEPDQQAFGAEDDAEVDAGTLSPGRDDRIMDAGDASQGHEPQCAEREQRSGCHASGGNGPGGALGPEDKREEAPREAEERENGCSGNAATEMGDGGHGSMIRDRGGREGFRCGQRVVGPGISREG